MEIIKKYPNGEVTVVRERPLIGLWKFEGERQPPITSHKVIS